MWTSQDVWDASSKRTVCDITVIEIAFIELNVDCGFRTLSCNSVLLYLLVRGYRVAVNPIFSHCSIRATNGITPINFHPVPQLAWNSQ